MAQINPANILFLDIETSFKIAGIWDRFNQNIAMNQLLQDTHVLCWCASWLGSDETIYDSLHLHSKEYKKDPSNDKVILQEVWKLLDRADYVVAHNGARFDVPVLYARFIQHGMQPPSKFQVVDTLQVARRAFKFTSNRLEDLGKSLGLGGKADTGGFDLWKDVVIKHDLKAFDRMVDYCIRDVELLEQVYLALRPWDNKHPSTVLLTSLTTPICNVCGSNQIYKNGSYATSTQTYQKYRCKSCGHSMRSRKSDKLTPAQRANLLRSI